MKSDYILRLNFKPSPERVTPVEVRFNKVSLYQVEKVFYALSFALCAQEDFLVMEMFIVRGDSMVLVNKSFKHGVIGL